jgi:hypothetical protein
MEVHSAARISRSIAGSELKSETGSSTRLGNGPLLGFATGFLEGQSQDLIAGDELLQARLKEGWIELSFDL